MPCPLESQPCSRPVSPVCSHSACSPPGGSCCGASVPEGRPGDPPTRTERFATNTYALTTDNLDIDLDGADWLVSRERFGKVRELVEPHTSKPVFVGVARTADAARYLSGTSHDLVTDLDYSPFNADYRRLDGERSPTHPPTIGFGRRPPKAQAARRSPGTPTTATGRSWS